MPQAALVSFHGQDSAIDRVRYVKITDKASWAKLWCEHSGKQVNGTYSWYYNPLNVPDVDFRQCMVVAIFQGKVWNSAGVKLVELVDGKDLTLRFDDLGFQTQAAEVEVARQAVATTCSRAPCNRNCR